MAFDSEYVRNAWNTAAEAYANAQSEGLDFYRYEFFGPAQIAMCGEVKGLRVLDVGCGSGYFSRAMAERGATVVGVDIAENMIEHARTAGGDIEYQVLDAAKISPALGQFDLVTSCLALQDMPNPDRVMKAIYTVMKPRARLVASIEHPCTATPLRGWERGEDGKKRWLCIDRYYERGPIEFTWKRFAYKFTTSALHVTLSDWFTWFIAAGLQIRAFDEPRPTKDAVRKNPDLADARRVPYFAMFDVARP